MKSILLLLLVFTISNLKAETLSGQAKIDSLLAELPKAKGDTNEINLYALLSYEFIRINSALGFEYGKKGLELSREINWKLGEAKCLSSMGTNFTNQTEYTKAIKYYQKALKINKEIGNKSGIASIISNIGIIYFSQSNYTKAMEYFKKALRINEEIENKPFIAVNLGNIGMIYTYLSNYQMAMEYYKKALKINKELENKSGIANNLTNIGLLYIYQTNYPKALEYYQITLKIYLGLGEKRGTARNLENIGFIYMKQTNYPKALEYYQKALTINKEISDKSGIISSCTNIGELYNDIGKFDKSLEYLMHSFQLSLEIGEMHSLVEVLIKISNNYLTQANQVQTMKDKSKPSEFNAKLQKDNYSKKALQYGLRAEKIADSNDISDQNFKIYETLSKSYKNLNDPWKSLEYHEKYTIAKDSIFNQENRDKISALEQAREDDLKQKEIEKQKIRIEAQEKERLYIIYSSTGALLSVLMILGIIFNQRRKSDKLLYNVLPVSIAKRLKKKEHPISDYFTQASIIFIDIVGFTAMSKDSDPTDIVQALNKVFTHYDAIANKYGLEKIKTIGDSYMAAAGIPEIQEDNTLRAAKMAIEVRDYMVDYYTDHGFKLDVRIGLDCGPVVAGVIGENKFIYDLWSDAVNTASRMESSSIAGQVQVSERFKEAVTEYEQFDYVERGEMEIKGKGKMKTFFMGSKVVEAV